MASACVNNVGRSPDGFLDCPPAFPKFGWLSPRVSLSRDEVAAKVAPPSKDQEDARESSDLEVFEFRLEDPVNVLPADELFSDGKLVPLHLSMLRPSAKSSEIGSMDTPKSRLRSDVSGPDPYLFSPKAPRCSSRWKELLGLKKMNLNNNVKQENQKLSSSSPSNAKSLKHFLHRSSKPSSDSCSLNLPLLKDSDNESVSVSSRLSLSSSSSGHDHDDLPRLSLDSEKPNSRNTTNPSRVRVMKHKSSAASTEKTTTTTRGGRNQIRRPAPETATSTGRGVSVDSPRMNSSGKIVFQSLERSSSSPSSFNGGPRLKYRGMERSYSANVRVTPVLNVPVCSLRGSSKSGVFGFQLFSSPQKRDSSVLSAAGNNGGNRVQQSNSMSKNRTDRN